MQSFRAYFTRVIFFSRWLQAPLYFGLIIVLGEYAYRFLTELTHLVMSANRVDDTQIMLGVLDLIDVVMIANLLIMVIIGGYETFISPLNLQTHPDKPEWLEEVNAGTMKVKLALALIGISSIHLLRTFIDPSKYTDSAVKWQVYIHLTLLISAVAIASTNFLMTKEASAKH